MRIIRYLSNAKWAVLLIALLLIVQAFSELSLPRYTSDLVDVGIQQAGVESAAVSTMRETTFNYVCMLASDKEESLIRASYEQNSDGNYELTEAGQANESALSEALELPLVLVYFAEQVVYEAEPADEAAEATEATDAADTTDTTEATDAADASDSTTNLSAGASTLGAEAGFDLSAVYSSYTQGLLTKSEVRTQAQNASEALGVTSDSLLEQQAILAATAEYEVCGVDLDSIQMNYLLTTGAKMMGITAVMMIASILVGLLASRTAARIAANLRAKFFAKVVSFSEAEVHKFSAASLITRGTNDIQQIQMTLVMLMRMVLYSPILAVGGIIMVARTNPAMSWIIVVGVVALAIVVAVLFSFTMPKFRIMQKLIDKVNLVSREMLTGAAVVRAFGQQERENERFNEASTNLYKTQLFTNRAMALMMPAMTLIMNGLSVLIVWVGGSYINAGIIQTGDMIAFITYCMVIVMSFLMIGMIAVMLPRADVAAGRVNEVLETPCSIQDPQESQFAQVGAGARQPNQKRIAQADEQRGLGGKAVPVAVSSESLPASAIAAGKSKAASAVASEPTVSAATASKSALTSAQLSTLPPGLPVSFDNVTFAYQQGSEPVLQNITFEALPGQTTAIIGSTGCGKSTLLKLIERFYDVTSGAVRVGGVDVRNLAQSELRSLIGYVPQQAFLFSGTVGTSIAYGAPDATDEELYTATEVAQARDFIEQRPGGFASPITQGGTNVSGGQRQRLTIARALATNAPVLLFDDSFSALDYATDARLRQALAQQARSKTVIIVAQRIATVLTANKIVVLDGGHIVGVGTHEQLMATCKTYREIAESQLSAEELAAGGVGHD